MLGFLKSRLSTPQPRRVAEVGWAIAEAKAALIWDDPEPFRRDLPKPASAKSVQGCPAAIDFDARHIVVRCPVDLNLRIRLEEGKPPALENADGLRSTVRSRHLGQMVSVVSPAEWRHPKRPIIQIVTPYVFLADEVVYLNQVPPYLDYTPEALPGVLISGRFPVHVWPRPLMWAFEWHDTSKNLVLRRGQPWFYVRFDTPDPSKATRLVEAEITPAVQRYIDELSGVTNYVNRTYSLFERARRRRPERLLVRRAARGAVCPMAAQA
ncbi:hypothetical protein [Methylobacterium durans]|uniref:Uncharacterized protein n=1 Tax=Methylobacterium durans TaxID=2202825 RepID=A0A2U8WE21_9HYPH|nr:hypothetical protein [Methylobacterium durans]AWN44353.1 hypothetical protein DK389_03885 [Methylobacterium durans]